MKKVVSCVLAAAMLFGVCGTEGPMRSRMASAEVNPPAGVSSSIAEKKTTKDSFLVGSWVSYYPYAYDSYEDQTKAMADAGLNFNIFPHVWETDEIDTSGRTFWENVEKVYSENNMVYLIDDHYADDTFSMDKAKRVTEWAQGLDNCIGYRVIDEPHPSIYESSVVPYYHEIQRLDSERFAFVNLLPAFPGQDYREYVTDFIEAIGDPSQIEYLSHDYYPFNANGDDPGFFAAIEVMRSVAYENGKLKTHAFPQSSQWNNKRMPNVDELRWNAYAYLAYGFKALSWFNLVTPGKDASGEGFLMSPIHRDGVIYDQELYDGFVDINWEMRGLGDVLMNLDTVHAYHTRADVAGVEVLPDDWAIQPIGDENLVISEMEAKDGSETHIMVFNKSHTASVSPQLSIDEYSGITGIEWLNPDTGEYEKVSVQNMSFNVELKPGEGKLFRLLGNFNSGNADNTPVVDISSGRFTEAVTVNLSCPEGLEEAEIRYTLDGSYPDENSPLFTEELLIGEELGVRKYYLRAALFRGGRRFGQVVTREYFIVHHGDYTDKIYQKGDSEFDASGGWHRNKGRIAFDGGSFGSYLYQTPYENFAAEAEMHLTGLGLGRGGFLLKTQESEIFVGVSASGEILVDVNGKNLTRAVATKNFDRWAFTLKVIRVEDNLLVYLNGEEMLSAYVPGLFGDCRFGVAAENTEFAADSLRALGLNSEQTVLKQPVLSAQPSISVVVVDLYTKKADVIDELPDTVTVQAEGGITETANVTWDSDYYDRTVSGDHTFYGTISLANDSACINPENVRAEIIVRVRYNLVLWEVYELLEVVDSLNENDYTAESWDALMEYYERAILFVEDRDRPQSVLAPVLVSLNQGIDGLVNPSLKTFTLTDMLNDCNNICAGDYTPSSYAVFANIVDEIAEQPLQGPLVQADIDARIERLKEATNYLVPLGDTMELELLLAYAGEAEENLYTKDSWNRLQNAVLVAEFALESADFTQSEAECYSLQLRDALRGLVSVRSASDTNENEKVGCGAVKLSDAWFGGAAGLSLIAICLWFSLKKKAEKEEDK